MGTGDATAPLVSRIGTASVIAGSKRPGCTVMARRGGARKAPLPPVEVSAHLFWRPRTQNSPLRAWLCSLIKATAADLQGGAL
jgi:hypothetical protein